MEQNKLEYYLTKKNCIAVPTEQDDFGGFDYRIYSKKTEKYDSIDSHIVKILGGPVKYINGGEKTTWQGSDVTIDFNKCKNVTTIYDKIVQLILRIEEIFFTEEQKFRLGKKMVPRSIYILGSFKKGRFPSEGDFKYMNETWKKIKK